jgi:hypothetical protein
MFPFFDHMTLAEADKIESWRRRHPYDFTLVRWLNWSDHGEFKLPGRTAAELRAYMRRNPRAKKREPA